MTNLCECVSWEQGLPWKPVQMAKDNWEMLGWEGLVQVVEFGPSEIFKCTQVALAKKGIGGLISEA